MSPATSSPSTAALGKLLETILNQVLQAQMREHRWRRIVLFNDGPSLVTPGVRSLARRESVRFRVQRPNE
jgi:hypothetical protein